MKQHPFVLVLDDKPLGQHLFGDLKVEVETGVWVTVDRRCRLCNRPPLELLTIDGILVNCEGLVRS